MAVVDTYNILPPLHRLVIRKEVEAYAKQNAYFNFH